ncbi:protein of unknown function [Chryseobacterium sp. JV274]|nr:protein of unknown function [Chryseobacterium sp. JV274]
MSSYYEIDHKKGSHINATAYRNY